MSHSQFVASWIVRASIFQVIGIANSQLLLPDFLSNWTTITAGNDSTLSTHHVYHGLAETPLLVDVQVRAIDGPLSGFIFQASGHVIRDDDEPEGYGNVVYIYDDVQVIVSAPVTANNNLGRAIYTAQSPYWEGLHQQDSFSAEFRVRAWKASSLPTPNFYDTYILVSGSDSDSVSYVEFSHKLNLNPDLVICRIQFTSNTSEYSDFYADSTGAGNIMYNTSDDDNGYVIFGFNNNTIRVWAPSVPNGALFRGKDDSAFDVAINSATLEVYAWTFNGSYTITSLEQDISSTENNDIFHNYHYYFDYVYYDQYYYYYYQYTHIWTDLTFTRAWAKAVDGANEGFMFPGGGSLSYDTDIHAQPCTYGGLVYAFVEDYYYTRIDIWRPGNATNGALICIQDLNGAGNNAQASRDGVLVMRTMLIQCGILKPVENGKVTYIRYYKYIAQLGCKYGYTHYGDLEAVCTGRGWVYSQWNCSKNSCSDPTPEHGASNNTDNSNGSVVEIVCEEGYDIQGNTTIVCQTDGLWSDNTTCSIKDCGSPVPQNGAANSTNTTFGTVLKISCIPGYNLSGNAEIVCQANGSWSNYPTCEKINCGSPVPQYGAANSTNTTFGTVLKISCIPGYNLSGNAEIVCHVNGSWSNNPICEKINCGSPVSQYGVANSTNITFGTVVKITCIPGYNLSGNAEIVCQANGSWSNTPTCEKINCSTPVPQYGFTNSTNITFGTVVKISCIPGYNLSGNAEIVCQANGSWSNNPICEKIICSSPVPQNGVANSTNITFGTVLKITCIPGYNLSGNAEIVCQANGSWSNNPTCEKINCGSPVPQNGGANSTNTTFGTVLKISCIAGNNLSGNAEIVCQSNGSWSNYPTCEKINCSSPAPQYGAANSTNTTFGTVLKISCIPGYNLSGNAEIVCQANGSWSNYPTCEKINCGSPVPQYGAANSTNTTFGTVLKISCIPGYNLSGNAEIVCQANTFWSNKPTCEKINCGSPVPQYGTANSTNTTFGTVLKISCIPGYNLSGSSEIVCQANGSWSNNPTCEKINCGSPVPQHGTANDTISTYGTVLKITCDPGYSLSGNSEIVCQANGSWSNNPTCERRCQDLQCYNDGTCKDGQLTCNCTKGFEGNQCEIALFGKTCNAITKCKTQKAICKQSLCTCETGIYNEKLDICDSMPLYSYGSKDDTVLADIDDSCSVAIQYKQGVPVFDQLYTDIYVCANGIVSFGAPFHNPTPTKHIFTHRDLNLLAPFYGDILISGGGRLFHRSFDIVNNASVLKSTEINNIENLIKTYGHIRSFETQFILIATWYKVKPWPETHNNSQEATFQMILITDGMETFALYIYGHDQMGWTSSGSDPNVYAGYIIGRNYYSHAYSFASPILKLDKYTETQGISGFTLKRLTSPNPESSGAKECLTWYRQNVNRKATIDLKAKQLPDCPCNFISLLFDPWFSFFGGAQSNGVYCTSAWSSPRTFPHGKTCCYNTSLWLWTDEKPIAGGFQFYHPSLYIKEHSIHDVNAKENCCQKSNLCNLYYDLHPVGTCYSRSWFWFGTFWGDPHFRTLDNFNFTFNGWGEYVLMNLKTNISDFELQARTERAIKDNGKFSDATVFSAFAVREDNMSLFHVGLNESRTGLVLYGNGIDLTRKFEESDDDKVTQILTSTPNSSLEILKINKTVRAVFTLTGVSLEVSLGEGMLNLNTMVPNVFMNLTRGLLGNFDGRADNDLRVPNGTVLSNTSTEEQIHTYGQLWEIDGRNSAFVYENLKNHSSYQNNSHIPNIRRNDSVLENNADKYCKGVKECKFDYIHAGEATANSTFDTDQQAKASMKEISSTVPKLIGCDSIYVKEDTPGECPINVSSEGEVRFEFLNANNKVTFNESSRIMKVEHGNYDILKNIRLIAESKDGRKSPPFSPNVLVCSGCNRHGRCKQEPRRNSNETSKFKLAVCDCDPGYAGEDCAEDFDGCASEPCSVGRRCIDFNPAEQYRLNMSYNCSACPDGFQDNGLKCEDIDECTNNSGGCFHICHNTEGSYECRCRSGYRTDSRNRSNCIDVNECDEVLHNCTQRCVNTDGSFQCSCFDGFTFNSTSWLCMKDQVSDGCENMGVNCSDTAGCTTNKEYQSVCFCELGYELVNNGTKCQDINECKLNVCQQNCTNLNGSYECSCFPGYKLVGKNSCKRCDVPFYGHNCENQCNCIGRGAKGCHPVKGCECLDGWKGDTCDDDINECDETDRPCNDVTKECVNTIGSYFCKCRQGFTEKFNKDCTDIDECSNPTLNVCNSTVQTCTNTFGGYTCGCKPGYSSLNGLCQDIDECSIKTNGCEQLCQNVPGQYNCYCEYGYILLADRRSCKKDLNVKDFCKVKQNLTCSHFCKVTDNDEFCACKSGFQLGTDKQSCIDIDECSTTSHNNCSGNAVCRNTNGSYLCECPTGTKMENNGRTCSECDEYHYGVNCSNTCQCLNGVCNRQTGCKCENGWAGTNCDKDLNECDAPVAVCSPPFECVNNPGSYDCICRKGFYKHAGKCEDINECADRKSNNCDQICINSNGSYRCDCEPGFAYVNGSCQDIDECLYIGLSGCHQACENTVGGYKCYCNAGYQIDTKDTRLCKGTGMCNTTMTEDCRTKNASCVLSGNVSSCICEQGYYFNESKSACIDIQECSRIPKPCSQKCTEKDGGFTCSCEEGYYLLNDYSTCKECEFGSFGFNCRKTCNCAAANTASCSPVNGTCKCLPGWTGDNCSVNIDECKNNVYICPNYSQCMDRDGGYDCKCKVGYFKTGEGSCEECASGTFGEGCKEICACSDVGTEFCDQVNGTCHCKQGWRSANCSEDVNECLKNVCSFKANSNCTNMPGYFTCKCLPGFKDINGKCEDIDECLVGDDDCLYNCSNTNGGHTCSCYEGFQGVWNNCTACTHNEFGFNCSGTCACNISNVIDANQSCDTVTGKCKCNATWTGERCETDVNECLNSSLCSDIPNSVCQNIAGGYICDCRRNYQNNGGSCVPKPTVPTTTVNLDVKKVVNSTITLDVELPDGYNLESESGYKSVSAKVHQSLMAYYKEFIKGDFEIQINNIRRGGLEVYFYIIFNKGDENAISALISATAQIASGSAKMVYDGSSVQALIGKGTSNDTCDIYTSLFGPCADGLVCKQIEGIPMCRSAATTDKGVLTIIIAVPCGVVFILILFFTVLYWVRRARNRDKRKKSNSEVRDTSVSSSEDCHQHQWQHGTQRGGTWKSMVRNLFGTRRGENMQPCRLPRPELNVATFQPKILFDHQLKPYDTD